MITHQQTQLLRSSLFTLSMLVLLACNPEDSILPSDDPNSEQPKAYLSLAINTADALATRSYDGTSQGTVEERYVQSVRIVLYNGNADAAVVVKAMDYDIETSDSQFVTPAREVPVTDYYLLAIVNPNAGMIAQTATGKTWGEFKEARKIETADKTGTVGGLAADRNFAMTNSKGLISVPAASYLWDTKNQAHQNPVPVAVERMVAKVTLQVPGGGTIVPVNNSAQVAELTWGLNITNRWTYWIRRGTEGASNNRADWYAEDPNYTNTSLKSDSERNNEFFYYQSQGNAPAALSNALNESEYCLENTMSASEQTAHKVITHVLIRCKYKPASISAVGESYCTFSNASSTAAADCYSLANMKSLLEIAQQEVATGVTPSRISQAILNAQSAGYDFSTGGTPKYQGNAVTASFQTNEIKYYHQGVNFYAIKVMHWGNAYSDTPESGHYGVLRNTHYTVTLTKVLGPGAIDLDDETIYAPILE